MACNECGAKRGHLSGCTKDAAKSQTAGRRKSKGLGMGVKTRKCFSCNGEGTITNPNDKDDVKKCRNCDGSGTIEG